MNDTTTEAPANPAPATNQGQEQHLFRAHVGQISLAGTYLLVAGLLLALAVTNAQIPDRTFTIGIHLISLSITGWALYQMLYAWLHTYEASTELLKEKQGVLNIRTDLLEIYRIKDVTVREPLHYRFFGAGNVIVESSDRTTPVMTLKALPDPNMIATTLRDAAESARVRKGVREID